MSAVAVLGSVTVTRAGVCVILLHVGAGARGRGGWTVPPGGDVEEGDDADADDEQATETSGHDADQEPVWASVLAIG